MPGNQEKFSSCFTNSVCNFLLKSVYVYIHISNTEDNYENDRKSVMVKCVILVQ